MHVMTNKIECLTLGFILFDIRMKEKQEVITDGWLSCTFTIETKEKNI